MRVNGKALLGLLALGLTLGASTARAATLCVNTTGASPCYGNIQDAVDAAGPGDTINISAGTYWGTGNAGNLGPSFPTVTIGYGKDGLKLVGSGTVILDPEFKTGASYDAIDIYSSFVSISNITIRNGQSIGIWSYWNTGLNLNNIRITGTDSDCVYLTYSDFATIKGLKCSAAGGDGIYLEYSDFLTATANTFSSTYYGVYGYISNNPNISTNTFVNPYEEGIEFDGSCCSDISYGGTIKSNKINTDYYEGVYLYYHNGVNVSNNIITGTDDPGIYAYSDDSIFASNVITNPYSYGIEVGGQAAQIKSNIINNADDAAIYLSSGYTGDGDSGLITLNKITNYAGGEGIENYGNHVTISSNTIANTYYGIYSQDEQPRVYSNTVTNSQYTGIYIYCSTCYGGVVNNNTVTNASYDSDAFDIYAYNAQAPLYVNGNVVNRANYDCYYLYGYTGSSPVSISATGNKGSDCGYYERYGYGFQLESGSGSSGLKLTNNVIQRVAGDGYHINAPGAILTGNSVDSATEDGFDVHTRNVTLTNNKATNNTGAGFEFNYLDDYYGVPLPGNTLTVTGNTGNVGNAVGACVAQTMASLPTVVSNTFGVTALPNQCSEAEGFIGN